MFCPHCGKETQEGYNHCFSCGKDTLISQSSDIRNRKSTNNGLIILVLACAIISSGFFAVKWYQSDKELNNQIGILNRMVSDLDTQRANLNTQISGLNRQISDLSKQADTYKTITITGNYPGYVVVTTTIPNP